MTRQNNRSQSNKYTYGPVPSRRLGFSLGIDIIPHKHCSFDCIYCQLGKTIHKTILRKEYTPAEEILDELRAVLRTDIHANYLTFSGSGEPTLHKRIGYLIDELKKITQIPVAVLTNGSLLYLPEVKHDLINADLVAPTLCTANAEVFKKIHRGHAALDIDKIIQGYVEFRKIYKGKIWLEVMIVRGINDEPRQLEELHRVIETINPDKIHLNTVVRPPSEKYAQPVSQEALKRYKEILGDRCEIIVDFKHASMANVKSGQLKKIAAIIERRPVTIDDLVKASGLHRNEIIKHIQTLLEQDKIEISRHGREEYYRKKGV